MNQTLIAATSNGVLVCERQEEAWSTTAHGLRDLQATSILAREGVILAGTTEGVFRSDDHGRSWREASQGMERRHVRWMAYNPEISDAEFVGTEPAEIYRSDNGGRTWQACPEVAELREQHGWRLPYSPEAGCVRGFAFHGQRAYAAVEVGGVLISDNGGQSWKLAEGSRGDAQRATWPYVHPDVHSIVVHPSSPDMVCAPTGGGFYRSADGGRSWELLYDCYCRAAWFDPADADHILLGPADYVDRNGRIEETQDGGRSWHLATAGLQVPWPRHMVERFYPLGDELLAVLSNGDLLSAPLQSLTWKRVLEGVGNINAATSMG